MTLRTAPTSTSATPLEPALDRALDEALDHIGDLAERLWAVRRLHRARRTLVGQRCSGCGHAVPCPTLRAASAA